jgi:hypothetical protein
MEPVAEAKDKSAKAAHLETAAVPEVTVVAWSTTVPKAGQSFFWIFARCGHANKTAVKNPS